MPSLRIPVRLRIACVASVLCAANVAHAQPSADQVLTDIGLSAAEKQRVLDGEFVSAKIGAVSERDLTLTIAFLCKTSPEALSKQILAGALLDVDPQVQIHGVLNTPGSPADLAALRMTGEEASELSRSTPGAKVNFSAGELAALTAEPGGTVQATQGLLQRVLHARYQAYRSSGLSGIAPYDRGGGRVTEIASDLRKASQAVTALQKYLPAFHAVLLDYPHAALPGMEQQFLWAKSRIRGNPTYVLTHILVAGDGAARAVVRREYYVSAGYNAEQSIAGFLPVQGGTVVVYTSHAFTDQVTGAGGAFKRSVGSRMMADKIKELFEAGRRTIEK